MKQTDILLIIVPDVHGRTFWNEIFNYDCETVFLGDYLDPYPSENIYPWDAMYNLTQIVAYAKAHPNVHLLLGNHDLCYSMGRHICNCRCDFENYDTLRQLFRDNDALFQLAHDCEVNGKRFFFSHAGLSFGWYNQHRDIFTLPYEETLRASYVNELYRSGKLNKILSEIHYMRGGTHPFGSIVWSDIREQIEGDGQNPTDIIQIVGHTQLVTAPLNLAEESRLYAVDNRKCLYLDTLGKLRLLSTGEEIT